MNTMNSVKDWRLRLVVGAAVALGVGLLCGPAVAMDNVGSGGVIYYLDSTGQNPILTTPYSDGYVVHAFTNSGATNLYVPATVTGEVLVVAGGGAGGYHDGGGGGAGGVIYTSSCAVASGNTPVTVGAGAVAKSTTSNGDKGGDSSFGSSLTATGGGCGGRRDGGAGQQGGSGGGGSSNSGYGNGMSPQGSNGASGYGSSPYLGGGGGGKGGLGGAASSSVTGAGGAGAQYTVFAAVAGSPGGWFAGGGSGGFLGSFGGTVGTVGSGGGGGGSGSGVGTNGVANTGGGGGGGGSSLVGGNGGSGIVLVRYPYAVLPFSITVTPANGQSCPYGSSIMATATVLSGTSPYSVTLYKNSTAVWTTNSSSTTFSVDLGVLPMGTNTIYATVIDSASTPATAYSTTNTFYVDNSGSGGTITYTDSSGLNPRSSPPYANGYVIHAFTNTGADTLNVPFAVTGQVLVVAGGGAGGNHYGGGGGAGGLLYYGEETPAGGHPAGTSYIIAAPGVSVSVGAGGTNATSIALGTTGGDSTFAGLTAYGGGRGGTRDKSGPGGTGGSGGGGGCNAGNDAGGSFTITTPQQGYGGGNAGSSNLPGGGGGGAGGAGSTATSASANGRGGGLTYSISGTATTYARGGGGEYNAQNTSYAAAIPSTGNGGDALQAPGNVNGGSGIVLVRYPWSATMPPPTITVTPVNNQSVSYGSSITATATVVSGTAPYSVTIYTNLVAAWTTNSSSSTTHPVNLGVLPSGTYTIYAKVTDNSSATAYTTTNTFYVDNSGSGGTVYYVDSSGANPVSSPPYTNGYVIHAFTSIGANTLNVPFAVTGQVLVVAGGGAGGKNGGGGGGAGGVIYSSNYAISSGNTVVTNGGGGAPHPADATNPTNGGNSVFGVLIANGGGGGSSRDNGGRGASGGSGGGGGGADDATRSLAGTNNASGQGNNGGNGAGSGGANNTGGGGGGAGGVGTAGVSLQAGNGGTGVYYTVFASVAGSPAGWFAGGGAGGKVSAGNSGLGGTNGGGGNVNVAGVANTGGGGGGGGPGTLGGSGGSGIVLVRYPWSATMPPATITVTPANNQSFSYGSSIMATATVMGGTAPYSVTIYTNLVAAWTTNSSSSTTHPVNLGVLPSGTYTIYAKVTDNSSATAYTTTNTFYVDNSGSGGTITYTDSSGLNPRSSPPYAGGYVVHAFTSGDTLTVPFTVSADYLLVGGGGQGGSGYGGGGGAGGMTNGSASLAAGSYTIVVGGGGAGSGTSLGTTGTNSTFNGLTAYGGGGGNGNGGAGAPGGSGGGGGGNGISLGGNGTQGNNGGGGAAGTSGRGGGGGGAGGVGVTGTSSGGAGGAAGASSISGTTKYYAQGGCAYNAVNSPNYGGGDSGADGTANTGGGGGADNATTRGKGGSGIVIVRYPWAAAITITVTPANGQSIAAGSSIMATATVVNATFPCSVTIYTNSVAAWTTNNSSSITHPVNLGALPMGTYTIYAKVTDNSSATAYTTTNTFYVDNSGSGGTITYLDSSGQNPRSSPAYTNGYVVHAFTNTGAATMYVPCVVTGEVLVVAGGGAGGYHDGGGGGAGGVIYTSSCAVASGNTPVTVGAGSVAQVAVGTNGGTSIFGLLIATGGGNGGARDGGAGQTGGSGGGGSSNYSTPGNGTNGQGNVGGAGYDGTYHLGGGGGGKGGLGGAASSSVSGAGGAGAEYTVFAAVAGSPGGWFAGGGSGGRLDNSTIGSVGSGGGGLGSGSGVGTKGVANTGGGGGGGASGNIGGNGGSGIVLVRYLWSTTPPAIALSPDTLPPGVTDVAYSQTLTASGGTTPYTNTVISGSLPPGLNLAINGLLSGTPDTLGSYTFTVQVRDALGYTGSKEYTLAIQLSPTSFFWTNTVSGGWEAVGNWTNDTGAVTAPATTGKRYYALNFNQAGTYTASNTFANGFLLNQLNFGGATATLIGNSMTLTNNDATPPQVNQNSAAPVTVNNSLALGTNVTFGGTGSGTLALSGALSGPGGLTKTNSGTLTIAGTNNTYAGATVINGGTVKLGGVTASASSQTFTSDANSGIGTANTLYGPGGYVLALAFNQGSDLSINGVTFKDTGIAASGSNGSINWSLSNWGNYGVSDSFPGGFQPASGQQTYSLLNHFYWLINAVAGNVQTMTLTGLTPGQGYDARIYYRTYGSVGTRTVNWAFDPGLAGSSTALANVNEDANATGNYIDVLCTAGAGGTLTLSATNLVGASWHLYGFSLQAVSSKGLLPTNTPLSVAAGSVMDLNGQVQTVASLSDSGGAGGVVTNSASTTTATLIVNPSSGSTAFSGSIGGAVGLVKSGDGTQVLTGASAYSGGTTVSNGTLRVNGSVTGTVNVVSGATLGGTGAITGNVTYASGAFAVFTNGAPMRFTGPVTMNGTTVHIALPDNLTAGIYLLATNTTSGFSGTVTATPIIDSGSLVGATTTNIVMDGSSVKLMAPSTPTIVLSPDNLSAGMTDVAYSQTLTVVGGMTPYTNTVFSGSLPPGLGLTTGGVLSGTPTTAGNYSFTVQAKDAQEYTGTRDYTLAIQQMPSSYFWTNTVSGGWDTALNWTNDTGVVFAPLNAGRRYYALNFNNPVSYTASNTFANGFLLNQLNFGGATATLAGDSMTLTNNDAILPQVNQNSAAPVWIGNDITMGTNVTFGGSGGGAVTVSGAMSGSGGLTKTGTGILVVIGTNNTYSGATTINGGTLKLGGNPVAGASLWLDARDLSSVAINGSSQVTQWNDLSGNGRHASGVSGSYPTLTMNAINGLPALTFNNSRMNSALSASSASETVVAVVKTAGGVQAILGPNDRGGREFRTNGDTSNSGLQLSAPYVATLGTSTGTIPLNSAFIAGLSYSGSGTSSTFYTNGISIGSGTSGSTLGAGQTTTIGTAPAVVDNWIGLIGEIQVYNRVLTDTEWTQVMGYLSRKWFGGGNFLPTNARVSIGASGTLDLNGFSQTVASLSDSGVGGGVVTNSASAVTANLALNASSGSTTFSGSIGGAISVVKAGDGTQVLGGASAYSGGTTVSNGTLLVNGSVTGTVNVVSSATLGGSGAITGNVTYASGAFAVFTNGATMRFTGSVTMNGTTIHLTLPDNLPAGTYLLATNTVAGFSGTVSATPVIDSGSLAGAFSTNIVMDGSRIRLVAPSSPTITIEPETFPAGMNDVTYSQNLTDFGGATPYTNTVVSGSLPPGLSLTTDGVLSGTPTAVGTYTFTVQAQDAQGYTGTQAYTLVIHEAASTFFWTNTVSGGWETAGNWTNETGLVAAPQNVGRRYYTLNFNQAGTYTATNMLTSGFLVNQLNFGGATATLGGNSVTLTNNGATLPQVNQNSAAPVWIGNNITLGTDVTFGGSGGGTLTVGGAISGSGGLTSTGTRILRIAGINNTYSGATTINGGTLMLGVGGVPPVSLQNPGFTDPGIGDYVYYTLMGVAQKTSVVWTGDPEFVYSITGGGTWAVPANSGAAVGLQRTGGIKQTLTLAPGTYTLGWKANGRSGSEVNPYFVTVDGVQVGSTRSWNSAGSTWKADSQTFTISTAGSHTIGFKGAQSSSDLTVFLDDTTLVCDMNPAAKLPSSAAVGLAAAGVLDLHGVTQTLASVTGDGVVTNSAGSAAALVLTPSGSTAFSGSIRGAVSLTMSGTGTQVLTGANTYSGGTTLSGGKLNISDDSNLGTYTGSTGTLTFSGGTLQFGLAMTVNASRAVVLGAAGYVDTSVASGTIDSAITGSGSLTMSGTGTLKLSGSNTYSGGTTVSSGTLLANNGTGSATGTGTVTVDAGGTLRGTGTVSGSVSNSGTVAAGETGTVGTLTVGGTLTFESGSRCVMRIVSNASHDMIVAGSVLPNGATLTFDTTGFQPQSTSGILFLMRRTNASGGNFAGLAQDTTVTLPNGEWKITYTAGYPNATGGQDIALIPPQGTTYTFQ